MSHKGAIKVSKTMHEEDQAWLEYRRAFADIYDSSNYSSPLQASVMRASHRLTEREFGMDSSFETVLEVGAGTGEHFPFVRHGFSQYVMTDQDPRTLDLAHGKLKGSTNKILRFERQRGERLSCDDNSVDRLIATHVLEHLYEPHLVLKEWQRVVRGGGVISILIPTDPGLAWRCGRHFGPRRNAMRQGIAYDYIMAREHVNSSNNLIALIRHYFPLRLEAWWPLRIPSIDLNLFYVCHATVVKT